MTQTDFANREFVVEYIKSETKPHLKLDLNVIVDGSASADDDDRRRRRRRLDDEVQVFYIFYNIQYEIFTENVKVFLYFAIDKYRHMDVWQLFYKLPRRSCV